MILDISWKHFKSFEIIPRELLRPDLEMISVKYWLGNLFCLLHNNLEPIYRTLVPRAIPQLCSKKIIMMNQFLEYCCCPWGVCVFLAWLSGWTVSLVMAVQMLVQFRLDYYNVLKVGLPLADNSEAIVVIEHSS